MLIAERTKHITSGTRGAVYREALRLQAEGKRVLKINTGNPAAFGFTMPESLKKAISENLIKAAAYSESSGMEDSKKAILQYNLSKGFKDINTSDIFLGNGVSELAEMICSATVNPGDEVLCPSPNYNLWSNSIYLANGVPVFYECFEDKSWMPDAAEIESHITDRTRAIVVINPNNPTGSLYSDELLLSICDIARKHKLMIFSDEIYDRLLMDGKKHTSIASLAPDLPVITFNGLSKSHIVCGLRCGWMTLSGCHTPEGEELKLALDAMSSVRLCSNTAAQLCIPAALADSEYTEKMLAPGGEIYERREACINAVNKSECMSVIKNTGALYCFVRINPEICHIEDDKDFAMQLVRSKNIMIVPGSGFDYPKQNYFRIVMLPTPDELAKAVELIDEFCKEYNR